MLRLALIFIILQGFCFAQVTPIAVTGFNHDAIAEGPPNSLATTTLQMDGASSNKVMYTNAFRTFAGIAGGGLPDNGLITAGGDTWQLANYTGLNALYVYRNETFSLSLVTPQSYGELRILALSTEGASSLNITVNFTDGSSANYSPPQLPDWFNGTTNLVLQGFGRCDRSAGPVYNADAFPSNPRMYFLQIPISCADRTKLIQSVTFSNVSTFPNNAPFPNSVILGISGKVFVNNVNAVITPTDCNGPNGSIDLTITLGNPPYTYSWNTTPVQTGSTAVNLPPGQYTATITDANGCIFSFTGTVHLVNNATMTASANPANAVCPGTSVQLTATPTNGNLTNYQWSPGTQTGTPITVTPATTTIYTVTGTNAMGCIATAQVTVNVNQYVTVPVIQPQTICAGQIATFTIQNPVAGATYNWYDVASGGPILGTGTTFITVPFHNNYTFHIETISPAGCTNPVRSTVLLTVNQSPAAPVVNAVSVCHGTNGTLTISNPQAGYTYNWYAAATGGSPLSSGTTYTATNVTTPVTVYAEAVAPGNCISTTRTAGTINLIPQLPQPVVTVTNVTFSSITFSWNAVAGATGYEITTNGGASYQPPSSGTNGNTHTISGLSSNQTVIIQVRALGLQPCQTSLLSAPVPGTTFSSKEIFVPNVFTPNFDGKNDVLYVYGNYVQSIQFRIFNQWGQLIFVSENITKGWDGRANGTFQPVGVYAYTLKVVLQDGTVVNKKGSVNLLR